MPTFNKNQKGFYSTRREVLKKFRDEENSRRRVGEATV